MTLIRILVGLINAILRAASSSLLLLISTLVTVLAVLALVGFLAFGLTGIVSLRLSRRRSDKRD